MSIIQWRNGEHLGTPGKSGFVPQAQIIVVVVSNATCLTQSGRGPRNSSWQGARTHETFGPTDFTSTYSVCTRRVSGGLGHQIQVFRSGVRWNICGSQSQAVFARRRSELKLKLLTCEHLRETGERTTEVHEQALSSAYHRQTYLLE
ncbi:hypothetical protein TNCV_4882491 [Trichonephila clavipes]|nr:hypothetical protein TNCV_4882491 [Trichonephila clavipes]